MRKVSLLLFTLLLVACAPATPGATTHPDIRVTSPTANAVVKSPLTVQGEAKGSWYFEASFPVRLLDAQGNEMAVAPGEAQSDWMTENFVPFVSTLKFTVTDSKGTLVLERDNPSGDPAHAAEIRIPVRFEALPAAQTEEVTYGQQDQKELKGFLAKPAGPGPHPALILIHEWWGLNDNIRDFARDFAAQGYVALAIDLYGESTTDQNRARELATGVRQNLDPAFDNLRQAVAYLKQREDVDDKRLASVGWCFGGGWSYQMAKNDLGVKASVMYYGQFSAEDDLSHMKADIIGHFGENDRSILVDDVREFQAKLETLQGEHEVFIYPNAGHGFANSDNATAYNPQAAAVAWQRTMTFLGERLAPSR